MSNRINKTYKNEVVVSDTLYTDLIKPIKSTDTIQITGYKKTADKEIVDISLHLDAPISADGCVIYTTDKSVKLVNASEMHITPDSGSMELIIQKFIQVGPTLTLNDVVPNFNVNGAAQTLQTLTIDNTYSTIAAGWSLKLGVVNTSAGLVGCVINMTLEVQ